MSSLYNHLYLDGGLFLAQQCLLTRSSGITLQQRSWCPDVLWSGSDTDGSLVVNTLTVCETFSCGNPLVAAQVVEEDVLIITFLLQVMDVYISTCKIIQSS